MIGARMIECPYCYAAVKPSDDACAKCGRQIARWQTGFYARQPLPSRTRTMVWIGAALVFLLMVGGFARSCHWF
jgi:hypothetical protein